jgi:hypothetical protein
MIKLKILVQIFLIFFLIQRLFIIQSEFVQIENASLFFLFIAFAFVEGINFDYISFLITISGAVLYNFVYPLEISDTTFRNIEKILIVIMNIWLIMTFYSFFKKTNRNISGDYNFNENTQKFVVIDGSFKYEISPDLIGNLKEYMQKSEIGIIDIWYRLLNNEEKQKVKRS